MSLGWPFPSSTDPLDPVTLAHAIRDEGEGTFFVRHWPQTYTGPESVHWTPLGSIPPAPPAATLDAATVTLERRAAAHPLLGMLTSSTRVATGALARSAPFEVALLCLHAGVPGGFAAALAAALRSLDSPEKEPALAAEIRGLASIAAGTGLFSPIELPEGGVAERPDPDERGRLFDIEIRRRLVARATERAMLLSVPRAEALARFPTGTLPTYVLSPDAATRRVRASPPTSEAWRDAFVQLAGLPLIGLRPLLIDLLEQAEREPVATAASLETWRLACRSIALSDRSLAAEMAARDRAERERRDAEAERIAAQARAAMRAWRPAQTPPLERWILAFCLLGIFAVSSLLIVGRDSRRGAYPEWTPFAMPDLVDLFPCRYDDECVGRKLDALVLVADSAGEVALATRAQEAAAAIRRGDCAAAEHAETGTTPPASPALEKAWIDAFGALYWRCLVIDPPSADPGSSSPAPSPGSSSGRPPPR